jgi:hypothetical protein
MILSIIKTWRILILLTLLKIRYFNLLFIIFFGYSSLLWSQQQIISPTDQKRYSIKNKNITESSGLACSTRDKRILWTHNDSGHMPIIYAISTKGKELNTYHLEDASNYDWEDMDAFTYQGENYLLIADTGDNFTLRWNYHIYIIKEPDLKMQPNSAISPVWSFSFKYEGDKSYDVEAVAVDIVHQKIVLLTKRTPHALIFELPLKPNNLDAVQIALKTGELTTITNPTALDITADGQLISVNTYRRIHRFMKKKEWLYSHSLKYKKLFQPEAMCLRKDKKYYYVTSEKKLDLLRVKAE